MPLQFSFIFHVLQKKVIWVSKWHEGGKMALNIQFWVNDSFKSTTSDERSEKYNHKVTLLNSEV